MSDHLSLKETMKEWHGTVRAYLIGFSASLVLTGSAFFIVIAKLLSGPILVYTLVGLALVQAIIQLLFFLHVGQEAKPRWETVVFGFMVMVLLILALGSLWIMNDLNDRVMSNMRMEGEMVHD